LERFGPGSINNSDERGQTLLRIAAAEGHEAVVKLLLGHGNIDSNNNLDRTPSSFAVMRQKNAIVKLLLHQTLLPRPAVEDESIAALLLV
jgi:ankyrin repeat protein